MQTLTGQKTKKQLLSCEEDSSSTTKCQPEYPRYFEEYLEIFTVFWNLYVRKQLVSCKGVPPGLINVDQIPAIFREILKIFAVFWNVYVREKLVSYEGDSFNTTNFSQKYPLYFENIWKLSLYSEMFTEGSSWYRVEFLQYCQLSG
jgi:hypothetical protein